MSRRWRTSKTLAWLAALGIIFAAMQARSAGGVVEVKKPQAIRVIQDPHTGMRWLLERTPENPGGPGRMVLLPTGHTAESTSESPGDDQTQVASAVVTPVLRAGDRLMMEEHSAIVDARLEAVALGPAVIGASFQVRLSIGGNVVRAIAVGPGRARFAPSEGFR